VDEINAEIKGGERECDIWGKDLSKLDEDLDTVLLDDLS
jgi:hypothetical protein